MNEVLHYLKTRRSALAMTLDEPAPDAGQIRTMIEIASRVPDHCKLAPWRFVEYPLESRKKLAQSFQQISDMDEDKSRQESREKQIERFASPPVVIGVISCPVVHPKVPEWEQVLSAGAVTMQLLIASNALGFEAQWLTGFFTENREATRQLGIADGERIAGLVHIGSTNAAKNERSRPSIDDIYSVHSNEGN